MPLRMFISHPIALAALAVLAIGVISYNIIASKKKKIPVRERRSDYAEDFDYAETESKSCDHQGVRKRCNGNTEIKKPSLIKTESVEQDSSSDKSKNESNTSSTNRTQLDDPHSSTVEKEYSFNNLDSLNQTKVENSKVLNIQNIKKEDSKKSDITKTQVDEDAESSVSNASLTNAKDLMESISQNSEDGSQINISEKLYKKEVCDCLKTEIETMSLSSSADSNLSENDDEDVMRNLIDLDNTVEKPVICKGCEESYANAVAYPCGHRYLCLDCAIKVHRIYKKCTVCNFIIETYDIFNTLET